MVTNNTPEGQGSEPSLGGIGGASNNARGRSGMNVDVSQIRSIETALDAAGRAVDRFKQKWNSMSSSMRVAFSAGGGPVGGGAGASRISVPMAGSSTSPATVTTGGGGGPGGGGPGGPGGGGPGGSGGGTNTGAVRQYASALNSAANDRIGRGAGYSLQADRMSVQLQQMYGMSGDQVRNQLRMPLTSHYLLGGGTAINDLLAMQANTGLTASKQASTVEAFRTVSGFSYGAGDITKMLSTMASPDVANRMFMMGGTGMYGLGGQERTGMQTIQDIVRRTGLTNPEALKGALQQGSNTRQRLTAMGVPQDMQDMVIQYAMQNSQYQRKTGGKGMYDPSLEAHRETMGIEGSYAVQHEKTTGERLKREEKFYSRQTDNFADFEKNLRTATKALALFEDKLSGIVGAKISITGHPITNFIKSIIPGVGDADHSIGDASPTATRPTGVSGVVNSAGIGDAVRASDESKLATLDPRLSSLLRPMLEENPVLSITSALRSGETQDRLFRERYQPSNKTSKTKDTDREWNGVIWEMKPDAEKRGAKALAPPGQSQHELGLAADLHGDINWVVKNAARFGLVTGYTGRGGGNDEGHHVEPQSTSQLKGGAMRGVAKSGSGTTSGASASTSSVRSSSARKVLSSKSSTPTADSGGFYSSNAGAIASTLTAENNAKYSSLGSGPSVTHVGDGSPSMGGGVLSGAVSAMNSNGMSITVSPNIYLTGGQDMSGDLRRLAKEVGDLLESEVKLRMMRRS